MKTIVVTDCKKKERKKKEKKTRNYFSLFIRASYDVFDYYIRYLTLLKRELCFYLFYEGKLELRNEEKESGMRNNLLDKKLKIRSAIDDDL